jgi:hypothetical protein
MEANQTVVVINPNANHIILGMVDALKLDYVNGVAQLATMTTSDMDDLPKQPVDTGKYRKFDAVYPYGSVRIHFRLTDITLRDNVSPPARRRTCRKLQINDIVDPSNINLVDFEVSDFEDDNT